jgi:hypothetical protein
MIMMRRFRFFAATPGRGTSIEDRLGANPTGRTIVSSLIFRCGFTDRSKPTDCSTKLAEGRCRAEQWRCGQNDHRCEEKCFADKIESCLLLKILATDVSKRWRLGFGASCMILAEPQRLKIAFNQWKAPAVTSCY